MKKMFLLLVTALLFAGCLAQDESFCQKGKSWEVGNGNAVAKGSVIGIEDYRQERYCHASVTAGNRQIEYYFKANETETYAVEKQGAQVLEVHTLQKTQVGFCPEKTVEVTQGSEGAVTRQKNSVFEGRQCCLVEEEINGNLTRRSCQSQDKQFTLLESYANASLSRKVIQEGNCTTLFENGKETKNC